MTVSRVRSRLEAKLIAGAMRFRDRVGLSGTCGLKSRYHACRCDRSPTPLHALYELGGVEVSDLGRRCRPRRRRQLRLESFHRRSSHAAPRSAKRAACPAARRGAVRGAVASTHLDLLRISRGVSGRISDRDRDRVRAGNRINMSRRRRSLRSDSGRAVAEVEGVARDRRSVRVGRPSRLRRHRVGRFHASWRSAQVRDRRGVGHAHERRVRLRRALPCRSR